MKPRVREVIVVEGRYDKNTLLQAVDAVVVETGGFAVFRNGEKAAYLRRLAEKRGVILLTDPDGAGFVIRNHLKGILPPEQVKQAYVPDVYGKERRKKKGGREGKLGVEGMPPQVLIEALRRAGATFEDGTEAPQRAGLTKADMLEKGLIGPASAEKRAALQRRLGLPEHLTANGLMEALDTLRMYEMFLGPLEQSKPWDTNGIDGVYKFLRRFWRLFYDRDGKLAVTDEKATEKELRTLHKTIKKVSEDIENFSFNTSVAAFMICLNELGECNKREVLEPLTVLLAPFAPHIAEELWETLGHTTSVCTASYPAYDEKHLAQSAFEYPVSVNGKLRFKKEYATSMTPAQIQADVVTQPEAQKWLEGKAPKKVIVVPGKIINIVI